MLARTVLSYCLTIHALLAIVGDASSRVRVHMGSVSSRALGNLVDVALAQRRMASLSRASG